MHFIHFYPGGLHWCVSDQYRMILNAQPLSGQDGWIGPSLNSSLLRAQFCGANKEAQHKSQHPSRCQQELEEKGITK